MVLPEEENLVQLGLTSTNQSNRASPAVLGFLWLLRRVGRGTKTLRARIPLFFSKSCFRKRHSSPTLHCHADDFKAIRAVQTSKVVLSPATGRLSHACEEIVRSRQKASLAHSGKPMRDVAAISAWGYGISRRGCMSVMMQDLPQKLS